MNRTEGGEAKVITDTAVQLPALLDLLHPEHQQPGHDEEHADPDDELDVKHGHVDEIGTSLCVDKIEPFDRAIGRPDCREGCVAVRGGTSKDDRDCMQWTSPAVFPTPLPPEIFATVHAGTLWALANQNPVPSMRMLSQKGTVVAVTRIEPHRKDKIRASELTLLTRVMVL